MRRGHCAAQCAGGTPSSRRARSSRAAARQGGLFHGRILLPPEYPFKPPTFAFLSVREASRKGGAPPPHRSTHALLPLRGAQPNGRFEVNTKICLSISTHHPEHWQPSWSLRTALTALVAFFPTKGDGAIGALDYTPQARLPALAAARLRAQSADARSLRRVRRSGARSLRRRGTPRRWAARARRARR